MRCSTPQNLLTTALLLVGFPLLTHAFPTPAALAPRCGSTSIPTLVEQITSANGGSAASSPGSDVLVALTSAGDRTDTLLRFENVPAGVYGCSLVATFPSSYPVTQNGPAQLTVRALGTAVQPGDTWATTVANGPGPVIGTVTLAQVVGSTVTITSGTCSPDMSFLVEVADWESGDASVEFTQYINTLNGQGAAGFFLTYNC